MKKLILIFGIVILTACTSEVTSINGKIYSIEDNSFSIDCSEEVMKPKGNHDDIGYGCVINITEDTKFRKQSGEEITRNQLYENAVVIVILSEPTTLDTTTNSRTLKANKIILE